MHRYLSMVTVMVSRWRWSVGRLVVGGGCGWSDDGGTERARLCFGGSFSIRLHGQFWRETFIATRNGQTLTYHLLTPRYRNQYEPYRLPVRRSTSKTKTQTPNISNNTKHHHTHTPHHHTISPSTDINFIAVAAEIKPKQPWYDNTFLARAG